MRPSPTRSLCTACIILVLLLAAGCSPEASKAKHLETADRHYESGAYDRAEVEYLNVTKADPKNGHAFGRLGLIYTAQGRTGRAIPYLMRGHELLPDDLDVRLRLGQLYLASGKTAEARTEALFILDRRPTDEEAPSLLVATLATPDESETIRQRLLDLPAPAPTGAPVLTALASLELRLGRVAEAEALLQKARAANERFAPLYTSLAAIEISKRNLPAAEAAFKQAAEFSPPRSPRLIQYAQFKMRSGDPQGAASILEGALAGTPDYVPAWIALADVQLAQNKTEECEASLKKALALDPQNIEGQILQSRVLNLQGAHDKAITLLEKLITTYPRLAVLHLELGRSQAAIGDITKAQGSLNQVLALTPGSPEATLLLARLHMRKGEHNAAIALLRRLVEQRPDLPQARLLLADAYRSQGSPNEALAIYRQLEGASPDNAQLNMQIGLTQLQAGRAEEARGSFEKAFTLNPDSHAALEQLVNLWLRARQFDTAIERIQSEIAKHPKLEGFGQLLLAKTFLAQNKPELAEERLKRAIELMPDTPTPFFLLAGIYSRSNQMEKALQQLNEVVTRNPRDTTALMLISVIHDQRSNYPAAREGYEKLLALNPRSVVALNNLAYLLSERLNETDKAQELAQRARQIAPNDPHSADTLGWILHRKRQYPWALSLLQEAADKLPAEAEVQYHLGLTHYMMGDEPAARSALERSLQNAPTTAWVSTARQALDLLNIPAAQITAAAKPAIDKALADRPDDPVALLRLAALHEREGKVDLAISALEGALKLNAHNVNILLTLARLHDLADHSTKALEIAKEARKLAPNDPQVAHSLGRLAYQNGDYPWAASLLQEAARQLPASAELQFDLALAAYSIGQLAETEEALNRALNPAGGSGPVLFERSAEARTMRDLLRLAANPAETLQRAADIEHALQDHPESVPALMASGVLSEARKDTSAAVRLYEQAVKIFPDFVPAKVRLAILGSTAAQFEQKHLDWALQARATQAANAELTQALGILTYRKGDKSRAISLLKEASTSRTTDALLFYYLGLAQLDLKDAKAGRESLEQSLRLGLTGDLAASARKALESAN